MPKEKQMPKTQRSVNNLFRDGRPINSSYSATWWFTLLIPFHLLQQHFSKFGTRTVVFYTDIGT